MPSLPIAPRSRVFALGVIAVLALAGCGSDPSPKSDQAVAVTANVTIELRYPLIADALDTEASAPEQYAGGLDYSKIATGAVVTFKDAEATIVGTAKLRPPVESDNLVICTWTTETEITSDSKFFTAEVGGWRSTAQKVSGGGVSFLLDTIKEDPEFGSTAEVDPTWTKTE